MSLIPKIVVLFPLILEVHSNADVNGVTPVNQIDKCHHCGSQYLNAISGYIQKY
jgi:hypothetical protein